jgi:hypothetical protein
MSEVTRIYKYLSLGKWERPSDKMAVYTEIEPGKRWGIRVTLMPKSAKVEAINGEGCSWYKAPPEISAEVKQPNFIEYLKKVTFYQKLVEEVESKREYAKRMNVLGK